MVVRGRGFWRVSTGDERAHHWHTPRPPCIHLVLAARAAAAAAVVAVATTAVDTHRRALLLASSSRRSRDRLPQGPRTRTPRGSCLDSRPPPLLLLLLRLLLRRHATPRRRTRRGCPTHHWLADDAHQWPPFATTTSSGRSGTRLTRRVTRDVPAAHTTIVQRPNRGDTASLSRANMELDPCRMLGELAAGRRARPPTNVVAVERAGRRETERDEDSARDLARTPKYGLRGRAVAPVAGLPTRYRAA